MLNLNKKLAMKKLLIIMITTLLNLASFAQTKKEKIEFVVTLRDGNIITGETQVNNISIISPYGKLEIPIKNINSIELGIKNETAFIEKIKTLCKLVSTSTGEQQKAAYTELVNAGIQAISVLNDFIIAMETPTINVDTDVIETTNEFSLPNALTELKDKHKVTEDIADIDIVNFDSDNNISGNYNFKNVALKTEFGTLDIPKEKIKKIVVNYENYSEDDKSFKLIASKHISGNTAGGYLKTNITVKAGQKIIITASGQIVLASLSNGKYTPDGVVGTAISTYYDEYTATTPTYGNVIFKIGENGENIKAGSKYSGVASKSGVIYLSIYETVYNAANTGSYSVKIKTN